MQSIDSDHAAELQQQAANVEVSVKVEGKNYQTHRIDHYTNRGVQ